MSVNNQSSPAVHVVILNWNGLEDTLECLESVVKLAHPNLVIHVVDNGSDRDESLVIKKRFQQVNVIRQNKNLGFCEGNNVAIRESLSSGADYVLLLNNDTLVPSDLISTLLKEAENLENVGAVNPIILDPENKIWSAGVTWEAKAAGFRRIVSALSYEEVRKERPYLTEHSCGCCMLIPARVIREVGLLDPKYFAFYDEPEWCGRMEKSGFKCYVIPSAFIYHKVSRSTPTLIRMYLLHRNRLLWMKSYLPYRERIKSYPLLIRELVWHLCNKFGISLRSKDTYSREYSEMVVIAWMDYLRGRFGVWPERIEELVNSSKKNQSDVLR